MGARFVARTCAHPGRPSLLAYRQTGLEAAALGQRRGGLTFSELRREQSRWYRREFN